MEHGLWEVLRPGATRVNLPWFSSQEEVSFIISAVSAVAQQGWKLLPLYRFNNETGEWHHKDNSVFKDRKWLGNVSFSSGFMEVGSNPLSKEGVVDESLDACLEAAQSLYDRAVKLAARESIPDHTLIFPDNVSSLRWFLLPSEAKSLLNGSTLERKGAPFSPLSTVLAPSPPQPSPGSLSGSCLLSPSTISTLVSMPSIPPRRAEASLRLSTRRQTNPRPGVSLQRTDSVTVAVNGSSSLTVNSANEVSSTITVNGFKSVISVGGNNSIESTTMSFGDEPTSEETSLNGDQLAKENDGNDCANGLCVIPNGKRSSPTPPAPSSSAKWKCPPKEIFKLFTEAVTEFSMIKDGDRILVCLSGGKDSLSLLHTMRQYQIYAKNTNDIKFDLGAVTVDPMSSAYDPRPLIPYLEQLGVEYLYEQQDIMGQALESKASSICAFCSRMKRGRIYAAARRKGYNVLAMGQHLDDISESFFMSIFHNGRLRTMKASYQNVEGDLRIIRPFVYVREKQLRSFAEEKKLPIIAENCPACFEAPKERHRVKQLLAQQELLFPRLYWNLKTALYPVMRIDRTGVESLIFGKGSSYEEDEDQL